jgi:hypothetical protein
VVRLDGVTSAIVLGVKGQADRDRRITPLNCSISADANSGYVYGPTWTSTHGGCPLTCSSNSRDDQGLLKDIGRECTSATGGPFLMQLFHFQHPSGRLDKAAFFSACRSSIAAFRETKVRRIIEKMPGNRKFIRAELDHLSSIIKTLATHNPVVGPDEIVVDECLYAGLPLVRLVLRGPS